MQDEMTEGAKENSEGALLKTLLKMGAENVTLACGSGCEGVRNMSQ